MLYSDKGCVQCRTADGRIEGGHEDDGGRR